MGQESGVGVVVGIRVGVGRGVGVEVGRGVNVGGKGVAVGGSPKRVRFTAMQDRDARPKMAIKKTGAKRFISILPKRVIRLAGFPQLNLASHL